MILNFPLEMAQAESRRAERPEERLFLMGETPSGRGPDKRWGSAVALAVLVHAAAVGASLAMGSPAREPEREEPELVFFQFAPPPPPASSGATVKSARPVQRQARKPVTAPVLPKPQVREPLVQKQPEPPVEPTPEVAEESAPEAPAEPVADAAAVANPLDGVLGGVLGGREGGLVGATGGQALDLKQVARAPRVLEQIRPHYPRRARSEGIEGLVLVRLIIGVDGNVEPDSPRVMRSVPELDEAALSAVRQWRFSPALGQQGRPVRVIVEIPVEFSLK